MIKFFAFAQTGLSGNLIVVTVLYYGGLLMTESQLTVGQLSSFLLYAAYVGVALGGLSSFYSEVMKGLGASSRLWVLLDRKPHIPIQGLSFLCLPAKLCLSVIILFSCPCDYRWPGNS